MIQPNKAHHKENEDSPAYSSEISMQKENHYMHDEIYHYLT